MWHNRTTIENIKEGRTSKWNVFMNRHSDKPSTYSVEDLNISPVFNFKYVSWRTWDMILDLLNFLD